MWYEVTFDFSYTYKIWSSSKERAISSSFVRYQQETGNKFYNNVRVEKISNEISK